MLHFTHMSKILFDVICCDINPTLFSILFYDTMFVTTQEHPLVVTSIFKFEEVLFNPLAYFIASIKE